MSAPRFRTGTFKRREKRVPGGRRVVHYSKKKPSKHVCAKCGKVLDAVPRGRPYEIRKLSKNQRRPNRPYGGMYCTNCTKQLFKEEARSLWLLQSVDSQVLELQLQPKSYRNI